MTSILLNLVLTLCLIAPQVHCQKDESSGDGETETQTSEIFDVYTKNEDHDKYEQHIPTAELTTSSLVSMVQMTHSSEKMITDTSQSISDATANTSEMTTSDSAENMEETFTLTIIVVLILVLVLTAILVAAVLIMCRRRKAMSAALKEDLYLDDEGGEKVPMPMFEDDVPSVLELEMEDLEKWMIKGDRGIAIDSTEQKTFS